MNLILGEASCGNPDSLSPTLWVPEVTTPSCPSPQTKSLPSGAPVLSTPPSVPHRPLPAHKTQAQKAGAAPWHLQLVRGASTLCAQLVGSRKTLHLAQPCEKSPHRQGLTAKGMREVAGREDN